MTKSDGVQQSNNQPTNGGAAAAAAVVAARQREVGGSLAAAARWQQRKSATSAAAWRRQGGGGSAKRGGGSQRDGSSAVEAAWRLLRWRQCDSATSVAARRAHLGRRMRQQKTKKINQIVGLGGSWTMILHNNQPKMCRHDGGGIIRDALPDGEVRGARSHRFWGDRVGRRLKNEIK